MSVWKAHGQDVTDSLAVLYPFDCCCTQFAPPIQTVGIALVVCHVLQPLFARVVRRQCVMAEALVLECSQKCQINGIDMPVTCRVTGPHTNHYRSVSVPQAGCPLDHRPTVLDLEVQSPKSPNGLSKNASFYIVSACFRITHSWTLDLFI